MCSSVFAGWLDDISFQDFFPRHENEKHLCFLARSIAFRRVIFHRAPREGGYHSGPYLLANSLLFHLRFQVFHRQSVSNCKIFHLSPEELMQSVSSLCNLHEP